MVHGSAMTQITAGLMEKTLQPAVPCNQLFRGSVSCFRSFDTHMLWSPRYLQDFFLQITKFVLSNLWCAYCYIKVTLTGTVNILKVNNNHFLNESFIWVREEVLLFRKV